MYAIQKGLVVEVHGTGDTSRIWNEDGSKVIGFTFVAEPDPELIGDLRRIASQLEALRTAAEPA